MQALEFNRATIETENEEFYSKKERNHLIKNPCQPQFFQKGKTSTFRNQTQRGIPTTNIQNMENNSILKMLFGSEESQWEYSEESLRKALELKICQERTKQEYYKVEALNRSIELMKLVAVAKVPTNLIPCVFGQPSQATMIPVDAPVLSSHLVTPNSNNNNLEVPSPSSPSPKRQHTRGRTISNLSELHEPPFFQTEANPRANLGNNPMASFKFGSGSNNGSTHSSMTSQIRSSLAPKHQLSPSRVGAHAISSLSRDSTNIRKNISIQRLRHGSSHQRTLSLPASVSIPESKPVEFHRPSYASKSSIFIPDLTGKTPNTAYNVEINTPKKRKMGNIKGFEYYKPNVEPTMSIAREEHNNNINNKQMLTKMDSKEFDSDDTTELSPDSRSATP